MPWVPPPAITALSDTLMQICASWAADSTEKAVQRECDSPSLCANVLISHMQCQKLTKRFNAPRSLPAVLAHVEGSLRVSGRMQPRPCYLHHLMRACAPGVSTWQLQLLAELGLRRWRMWTSCLTPPQLLRPRRRRRECRSGCSRRQRRRPPRRGRTLRGARTWLALRRRGAPGCASSLVSQGSHLPASRRLTSMLPGAPLPRRCCNLSPGRLSSKVGSEV